MGKFGLIKDTNHNQSQQHSPTKKRSIPLIFTSPTKPPTQQSHIVLPEFPKLCLNNQDDIELSNLIQQKTLQYERERNDRQLLIESMKLKLDSKNKEMKQSIENSLKRINELEKKEKEQLQLKLDQKRKAEELRKQEEVKAKELAEKQKQEELKKEQDKLESDRLKQEAQQKAKEQSSKPVSPVKASKDIPRLVSDTAWNEATIYLAKINQIKKEIKPKLLADVTLSNSLSKSGMSINKKIGQLTPVQSQIIPLIKTLSDDLLAFSNQPGGVYDYMLYVTAKKLVKQAEKECSVKKETAFPLAIVVVHLMKKHSIFKEIFLGRIMNKCSYIIPCYQRKLPNEPVDDYKKRLGYKLIDGTFESDIHYGERMCGILSLYAAIIQTTVIENPYGIENGWTWLARVLNMKPRKLTPLLILTFLEITGNQIMLTYSEQGNKLIHYVIEEFIGMIPMSATASTTKLKIFLEEGVMKTGKIPLCPGRDLKK